jgi:hypothetical protein
MGILNDDSLKNGSRKNQKYFILLESKSLWAIGPSTLKGRTQTL